MFIGGLSLIYSSGNEKREEVDLEGIIRDWTKANPKAVLPAAQQSIDAKLLSSIKAFRRKHPSWHPESADPFSYVMCFGYYMGLQQVYESLYAATPEDITNVASHRPMQVGRLGVEGRREVCAEIVAGHAQTKFWQVKSDPVVLKYREADASKNYSSISRNDLVRLGQICLEATESAEGQAFDHNAKEVGSPNYYAVIDERQGFKWIDPLNPQKSHRQERWLGVQIIYHGLPQLKRIF